MNQQEKIKAYLKSQLSPGEMAAFKQEILADPDLQEAVKAAKLLLITEELHYRDGLKTRMAEWKKEAPAPVPPQKRWNKGLWLLLPIIGLIGYWFWPKSAPVPEPATAELQTKDTLASTPDTAAPAPVPAQDFSAVAKFEAAILAIQVEKETAVAMKSQGRKLGKIEKDARARTGFILAEKGSYYVITTAYAVQSAGFGSGDVVGLDKNKQKHALRLVGLDPFYDVAVLAFAQAPANPQAIRFEKSAPISGKPIFAFLNPLDKSAATERMTNAQLDKYYGDFLRFQLSRKEYGDGPLIDETGGLVGMFSQYATAVFPENSSQQYALSTNLLRQIVTEILQQNGAPKRCYAGVEFSSDKQGAVYISNVLDLSPAEDETALIGMEVMAINGTKIRSVADVVAALREVSPGKTFTLTYAGSDAHKTDKQLHTRELNNPELEKIAEHALQKAGVLSLQKSPGNPVVRYVDPKMPADDFWVVACQIGQSDRWQEVPVTADFGKILRHIGLAGKGMIQAFSSSANGESNRIPIQYSKTFLWN